MKFLQASDDSLRLKLLGWAGKAQPPEAVRYTSFFSSALLHFVAAHELVHNLYGRQCKPYLASGFYIVKTSKFQTSKGWSYRYSRLVKRIESFFDVINHKQREASVVQDPVYQPN